MNAHIAIGELCRVLVYLFFLAEGMLGCEGRICRQEVFIEDEKVVVEALEHGLWGAVRGRYGEGASRTWRTGSATWDCAALTLRTGAPSWVWTGVTGFGAAAVLMRWGGGSVVSTGAVSSRGRFATGLGGSGVAMSKV